MLLATSLLYIYHSLFQLSEEMVSHVDIVPTVLDWFSIKYPTYKLNKRPVYLTGKSLLPVLQNKPTTGGDAVYASHNLHEVTMYYPMRVVRNKQYKLIRNLNFKMPFSIDQDFFMSDSFQDILNRTRTGAPVPWIKTLKQYYYRDYWELYDIQKDPAEVKNLVGSPQLKSVFQKLKSELFQWQNLTGDPWICGPEGVLEDEGKYLHDHRCFDVDNELGFSGHDEL